MGILDTLRGIFRSEPAHGQGALRDDEDYRDIGLASFQAPVDTPDSFDGLAPYLGLIDPLDQGDKPSCVPHAIEHAHQIYEARRGRSGKARSARFGYKLCKIFDGRPDAGGTYPRVGALVRVKYGAPRAELLSNDTRGTLDDYRDVAVTPAAYQDAAAGTFPGFGYAELTPEGIQQALVQNGAVCCGLDQSGSWEARAKPIRGSRDGHYVLLYGYEAQPDGDLLVRFLNSWGDDWPRRPRTWPLPRCGEFLWSDYGHLLHGAIAFADVPKDLVEKAKALPYKFPRALGLGDSHASVRELQKMLNADAETAVALDGPGSAGEETTYYGGLTQAAVAKWQARNGVPATGYFGPISVATANRRVPRRTLLEALVQVESSGNDQAVGDRNLTHKAYGALQIRQPYVDDVNRARGWSYRAQECLGNRELSVKIYDAYMALYATEAAIGRPVTDEDRARIHNGGPSGWRRASTEGYWAKVRKAMTN